MFGRPMGHGADRRSYYAYNAWAVWAACGVIKFVQFACSLRSFHDLHG